MGIDFFGGFGAQLANELFAREFAVEVRVDHGFPVENIDAPIEGLSQQGRFLFPLLGGDKRDLFGECHAKEMLPPGRQEGGNLGDSLLDYRQHKRGAGPAIDLQSTPVAASLGRLRLRTDPRNASHATSATDC